MIRKIKCFFGFHNFDIIMTHEIEVKELPPGFYTGPKSYYKITAYVCECGKIGENRRK